MNPLSKLWQLIKIEREDIQAIYFYAVLGGLLQLVVPVGIQSIVGFVMGATMVTSIIVLIIFVVIGVLLTGIFQMNQMKIIERIQQNIFVRNAFNFAEIIPRLDLKQIDQYYLPEKVNRFFDTITIQKSVAKIMLEIPLAFIQILFGLIVLSFYHPFFIMFGLMLMIILALLLRLSSKKGIESSRQESNNKYKVVEWLEEMGRVIYSFKFSQGSHLNIKNIDKLTNDYLKERTAHFNVLLFQYKSLIVFKVFITASMLIIGAFLLVDQKLNIGEFVAAEIIILLIINSVEKLIVNLDSIYDIIISIEKVSFIMESELEPDGTIKLVSTKQGIDIEVHNLSFKYQDATIFQNVSLRFPANTIHSIHGQDGEGKTTFLKLLSGNYTDFEGSILFDNIPLVNYSKESIRNEVSIFFLSQEIFKGTLWENISMGLENVTPEKIMLTAKDLGIEYFIKHFPQGFETILDPLGKRLSESMNKNILLLRALVDSPRLILLDNPFANLDTSLQEKLLNTLVKYSKQSTIVITGNTPLVEHNGIQHIPFDNGKRVHPTHEI